jgi:hypothetical protein
MTCAIPASGPPTLASDATDVVKLFDVSLVQVVPTSVVGSDGAFTINWDSTGMTGTTVVLIFREYGYVGLPEPRIVELIATESISPVNVYMVDTLFKYWVRQEDADGFGPWYINYAIASAAWTDSSEVVMHKGQIVYHGSDSVII